MMKNAIFYFQEYFTKGKKNRYLTPFLLLVFFVYLSGRLFQLVYKYSVNILFWDQWDFYKPLFSNKNLWEIFSYVHAPHRQGIAMVVDKFVMDWTSWDTRLETFLIVTIVLLTSILALFIKYRLFRKISILDILIPLLFLNAGAFESYLQVPNPAHSAFPLLIVVLYCFSLTIEKVVVKYSLLLLANFLGIYTGFSIFLGIITPVLIVLEMIESRKKIRVLMFLLFAFLVSILSFGSFFLNYQFSSASSCFVFPHPRPLEYIKYISLQYFGAIRPTGITNLGIVIGLILAMFTIFSILIFGVSKLKDSFQSIPAKKNLSVILVLVTFSFLFSLNNAIGRVCFSVDYGQSSRYYIYLVPGFLGMYFAVLEIGKNRKQFAVFFSICLIFLFGYSNFKFGSRTDFKSFKQVYFTGKKNWKECYVEHQDIAFCDQKTGFKIYPDAKATNLKEKLEFLKINRYNLFKE